MTYKSSKKMIKGDGDGDNSGSGNKSNSIAHSMVAKRTRVVKSKRGMSNTILYVDIICGYVVMSWFEIYA